jgi:hypothetical protein
LVHIHYWIKKGFFLRGYPFSKFAISDGKDDMGLREEPLMWASAMPITLVVVRQETQQARFFVMWH